MVLLPQSQRQSQGAPLDVLAAGVSTFKRSNCWPVKSSRLWPPIWASSHTLGFGCVARSYGGRQPVALRMGLRKGSPCRHLVVMQATLFAAYRQALCVEHGFLPH